MKDNKDKLAYLPMAVDLVHTGHLNIINNAAKLGVKVMVGCYSDEAIASYKRLPFMNYEQRAAVIGAIKGVDIVVKQNSRDLEENIRKYKPDYVVHGTDWKDGALSGARARTIEILAEWDGQLVEPEYTKNISSTIAHEHLNEIGTTPLVRQQRLRKLFSTKDFLRAMQVHDGMSAMIVENAVVNKSGEPKAEFDAFWFDSIGASLIKCMPNIDVVDFSAKLISINDVFGTTFKSLIYDGGECVSIDQLTYAIKKLEAIGVSAISIDENASDDDAFVEKLKKAKNAQVDKHFMVIPKLNNFVGVGAVESAIGRVQKYIEASADAFIITANDSDLSMVKSFCYEFKSLNTNVPIILIVSGDSIINEENIINTGVRMVIYQNNMIRASYSAMKNTVESILTTKTQEDSNEKCSSIQEITSIVNKMFY